MPEQIFVSYSHDDNWRPTFEAAIDGGVFKKVFQLWFDHQIAPGAEWKIEIENAISRSRIALLLVGRGFVRSRYIVEQELPIILERKKAGGMTVFWVPIDAIPEAVLDEAGLEPVQALWPRDKPLSGLQGDERRDALMHIGATLLAKIKLLDTTSQELLDDLRPRVIGLIGDARTVVGEPFARGDYSVFYRAKRGNDEFAIKAVVPSPRHPWLSEDFVQRANAVSNIANSTAIGIRSVFADPHVPCVAMDFVNLPTLAMRLKAEGKLDPKLVADVLSQLVRLAGQLQDLDDKPVIGPVRPSHVHYDNAKRKVFISLLPIVNETLASCRGNPMWLQDSDALPYLSPEIYYGKPIDGRSDQYYLGLLALELLQGQPPVSVATFADLQKKANFFKSPRSRFNELSLTHPAFSFVLTRMLEAEPERRWADPEDLVNALRAIAKGKIPEPVKQHADVQYNKKLKINPDFFPSFYRILFDKSDEIRTLFQLHPGMDQQSRKLDKAMRDILNFNQDLEASSLGGEVDSHRGLGIKDAHFDLFRDAFLDALREAQITDGYSQDAWRAVLGPALDYMRDQIKVAAT